MPQGARRLPMLSWRGVARRAWLALCVLPAPFAVAAQQIESARYVSPTDRYPHGVLGDTIEHAGLEVRLSDGPVRRLSWAAKIVFEDTAPRVIDVTSDGAPEVIVVESNETRGARLAVYGLYEGALSLFSAGPFIGERFRWLAVIGADDLDGDGRTEIAYIDRPHLAKVLRILRVEPIDSRSFALRQVATRSGLSNRRIGERDIAGGVRDCGAGPEMIVASVDWARLVAVRFDGINTEARDVGPHRGRVDFDAAMACK